MTASKRKGSAWERAIVDYLRGLAWPHAERRLAGSAQDRGDIAGIPGVVIEAKNTARLSLGEWIAEAEVERVHDGAWLGVVWHKRRGKTSAADGYVTMTGQQFARLLAMATDTPAAAEDGAR